MRAEIISVGTELLLGNIIDTNAPYRAQGLATLGIDCYYISQVGDNLQRLVETLGRAWERSELILTTGGLGPTQDDQTRDAIAHLLGETPVVDPELEAHVRGFFEKRGVPMPERNIRQAMIIPSAVAIPNPVGTAPGWWVQRSTSAGTRIIVAMPGVPFEMKRMWEYEVVPRLRPFCTHIILSRTIKVLGMGESAVEEKIADLMSSVNPTLAPYAKRDGIHLRITAKAPDESTARALIEPVERAVRLRLGNAVFGADDDTPKSMAQSLLRSSGDSYALLEVGEAVGAISELLAEGALAEGVVCAPTVNAALRLMDAHAGVEVGDGGLDNDKALEQAVAVLQRRTQAHLVLGVVAGVTSLGEPSSVAVEARYCLLDARRGRRPRS